MARLAQKEVQIPVSLLWFVFVYGVLLATINSSDTWQFNLQQIGIEALAERGTWYFEGSSHPHMQPEGDIFEYKGHTYVCKQPGQFVFGAVLYNILRPLGFSYVEDYMLTSSVMTALTSAFMVTLMAVFLFQIAHYYLSLKRALLLSGLAIFGTMVWPYSGVTHHDVFGTFFAFLGFYLLFYAQRIRSELSSQRRLLFVAAAGFFSGFTFFSSLLPFGCVLGTTVYIMAFRRWRPVFVFALSGLGALVPTFLYNYFVFDDLLNFPHIIGGYDVALPRWSWTNIIEKLDFYLISPANSFYMFSPVLVFALLGFVFWSKEHRQEYYALLAACVLTFLHLCTMQTIGHAQYGQRYLLPLMPFLSLGLIGILRVHNEKGETPRFNRRIWTGAVVFLGGISVLISGVGSLMGVMFKPIYLHPFPLYVEALLQGHAPHFVFAPIGVLLIITSVFVAWRQNIFSGYS